MSKGTNAKTRNKWLAGIGISLGILLALALALSVITHGYRNWDKLQPKDEEQTEDTVNGGMEIEDGDEADASGISLDIKKLSREEFALYDVSPLAETALSVSVTVEGADSAVLDWSADWANAQSEWATGKSVTDYVTVTPTSDGALTATVSCSQAFAEVIVLKAALRGNSDINITRNIQYVQKYADNITATLAYTNSTYPAANLTWNIDNKKNQLTDGPVVPFPGYAKTYQDFQDYYDRTGAKKGKYTLQINTALSDIYTKAATVEGVSIERPSISSLTSTHPLYKAGVTGSGAPALQSITGTGPSASIDDDAFNFARILFPTTFTYTDFSLTTLKQVQNSQPNGLSWVMLKLYATVNGESKSCSYFICFDKATLDSATGLGWANDSGDLEF